MTHTVRISEAIAFVAALSRQEKDDLFATEADELMDKMNVSEELRELVVADVVGGQYTCDDCFPDGCGRFSEEHNATRREKERHAQDVWDQPVSRMALIHEITKATAEHTGEAHDDRYYDKHIHPDNCDESCDSYPCELCPGCDGCEVS